ncbi:hypothetical protein K1719_031762 [Acacia pycnantha]|nr:hypothetical protein K1719_031762 [Acacia pycnantha]
MNSQGNGMSRVQKTNYSQREGTNWLLIVVGALLSTISIRLGFKWKQSLNSKRVENAPKYQKEMQDQLAELQNSLDAQQQLSSHLQSKLDYVNSELFNSRQRDPKAEESYCEITVSDIFT